MPFDYDLVIIGGTIAAREAALAASHLKARVALVEPFSEEIGIDDRRHQVLLHIGRMAKQMRQSKGFGLCQDGSGRVTLDWQEAIAWANTAIASLEERRSAVMLAASGVDVIVGAGEFCRRPQVGLVVNGRLLRSRSYLIAINSQPVMPELEGIAAIQPITLKSLWKLTHLPESLIILGSEPGGVELAQTLTRLGVQVTLIVNHRHLLPYEDQDAANLIQAQLEAEGVKVLTQTPVTQMKRLDGKKWAQAGRQAIAADEILLATPQQPILNPLNLEAIGVKATSSRILVNSKLQTSNPQVFACGEAIGGYPFSHIADYEAQLALKNALFFPTRCVHYETIPWAIFTDLPLARMGMTEAQARRRYRDVRVTSQSFQTDNSFLQGDPIGFCKLITRKNGDLLGTHLIAPHAPEVLSGFIHSNRLNIKALSQLNPIASTSAELLVKTAIGWQQQHLKENPWIDRFLHWRR